MTESKVFKVLLAYRKDTNSRFSNSMVIAKAANDETAKKMAKKITIARNPGIKEIVVNNCFSQTGDEIKKVPANRILTKENFIQWIKAEEPVTSGPVKAASKPLTNPSWLTKKPAVKSVTSTPAPGASKPLTNPAWLTKKPVVKISNN